MTWAPNLSPYVMMWCGEFRPVTWMGVAGIEVSNPNYATIATLYVDHDEWVATTVVPGDIIRRKSRPGHRTFLTIDD